MQESIKSVDREGVITWKLNGVLHRINGPAIENPNGTVCYYVDGLLHREDEPAIITNDGAKYWFKDGRLHRTDGPAIETINGQKAWFVKGLEYTEALFNIHFNVITRISPKDRVSWLCKKRNANYTGRVVSYYNDNPANGFLVIETDTWFDALG